MTVTDTRQAPDGLLRVLAPDGSVVGDDAVGLTPEQLLDAYRWMLLSRLFDEKAFSLQRQGRLGTFSPVKGQEASVVGSSYALDPATDWLVPQYREIPAMLRHGYPMSALLLYFMGNAAGSRIPDGVTMLPIQIALAAQLPHAVGLGWGLRLQRLPGVVMVYVGDGASSEGDFHEALNLAGVVGAPVVFVLQNNGWAISTPRSKQSAARTLASRAEGYGMPGEYVDGNDLLAVYDVSRRAVERARSGAGPTLIECVTYRLWAHNTADDPTRYVPSAEVAEWATLDPLVRLRAYLTGRGLLTDDAEAGVVTELTEQIASAVATAQGHPPGAVEQVFDHVYAADTPRLARQRAEWLTAAGSGAPTAPEKESRADAVHG